MKVDVDTGSMEMSHVLSGHKVCSVNVDSPTLPQSSNVAQGEDEFQDVNDCLDPPVNNPPVNTMASMAAMTAKSTRVSESEEASRRHKSMELKDHISSPKSYKTLTKHGSKVNEKILDSHSKEYYSFGESTWDLVIFIGTGALGPAGSLQTFLLAVVNVFMQGVFVGIAVQLDLRFQHCTMPA